MDLPKHHEVLNDQGELLYIGSASPGAVAEALIIRQFGQFLGPWEIQIGPMEPFLKKICAQLGTSIEDMGARNIGFSSAHINSHKGRYSNSPFPSYKFIQSTRDYLLSQPELLKVIATAQTASRTVRANGWLTAGVLGLAGFYASASSALSTLHWWQTAVLGSAALGGAVWRHLDCQENKELALLHLEKALAPPILHQWVKAAEEHGTMTLSIEDRWYQNPGFLPELHAQYAKTIAKIEDITKVAPEKVRYFIEQATINLPDIIRGFAIEVRPHSPGLAGTSLRILAFPTDPDEDGNRKKRNPKWNWQPNPGLT